MRRFSSWLAQPHIQVRLWAGATLMWLVLTPITMLTALANEVSWVSFMSLFANSASCATAWVAAMSYLRARRVDEANLHRKLDHIIESHPEIPALEEA